MGNKLLQFLKDLIICVSISLAAIFGYGYMQVHLGDHSTTRIGRERTLVELLNYKKEKCAVEDVDRISTSSVTLRYRCGRGVYFITQKAVDLEIQVPKAAGHLLNALPANK